MNPSHPRSDCGAQLELETLRDPEPPSTPHLCRTQPTELRSPDASQPPFRRTTNGPAKLPLNKTVRSGHSSFLFQDTEAITRPAYPRLRWHSNIRGPPFESAPLLPSSHLREGGELGCVGS